MAKRKTETFQALRGATVAVEDAIEDFQVEFLGTDSIGKEIEDTIEVVREYPNGTVVSMGRAYVLDKNGKRLTVPPLGDKLIMTVPTEIPGDPRSVAGKTQPFGRATPSYWYRCTIWDSNI